MSIKINSENYDTYKKVFEIICLHQFKNAGIPIPVEIHPVTLLNNSELKSKKRAEKELQHSLNDSLSTIHHYPKDILSQIEIDLIANNLPGIDELTGKINKTIAKVLLKKKINSIDQYYIVKEILDDNSSNVTNQEREILNMCLITFELKATNR